MSSATTFNVLLCCRFPPSDIARLCETAGSAVRLAVKTAERPDPQTLQGKVKRQMLDSDAVLFLLEDTASNGDRFVPALSDWMITEYGMAKAMQKPVAFVLYGPDQIPEAIASDGGCLVLGDAPQAQCGVKLAGYLYALREMIEAGQVELTDIHEPTYIREYVRQRIKLHSGGRLHYTTHVMLQCLKDGLCDLRHSIHMNYGLCWPGSLPFDPHLVSLTSDDKNHQFSMEPVASDAEKFTFRVDIDPPLRRGEETAYSFEREFQHYLPISRNEIEPLLTSYHLPEDTVEHHWFINNPTKRLELRIELEDGAITKEWEALAYVGRTLSSRTLDPTEVRRIAPFLKIDEFMNSKEVTLAVDKPRNGYTYSLRWRLTA